MQVEGRAYSCARVAPRGAAAGAATAQPPSLRIKETHEEDGAEYVVTLPGALVPLMVGVLQQALAAGEQAAHDST